MEQKNVKKLIGFVVMILLVSLVLVVSYRGFNSGPEIPPDQTPLDLPKSPQFESPEKEISRSDQTIRVPRRKRGRR